MPDGASPPGRTPAPAGPPPASTGHPSADGPAAPPPDPTPDLTPDTTSAPPQPETGAERDEPGRDRLVRALRRPGSRGQLVVALLLGVLGFAAVVQVRAYQQDDSFTAARQSDLIALINTLSLATDRAQSQIRDLERTRDSLLSDTEATKTAIERAREQADSLGILAGTRPAVGPGVRLTVKGPPGAVGTDQLLNGLEELRNAGAEAIEINDAVRVVAQTAVTDGSSQRGVAVDGVELRPPYVIEAIGDPETLATAMEFEGGFAESVQQLGGTLQVQKLSDVEIASTREPPDFRFAEPVEPE